MVSTLIADRIVALSAYRLFGTCQGQHSWNPSRTASELPIKGLCYDGCNSHVLGKEGKAFSLTVEDGRKSKRTVL